MFVTNYYSNKLMVISIKILGFFCQPEFLKNLFYFRRSDLRILQAHITGGRNTEEV